MKGALLLSFILLLPLVAAQVPAVPALPATPPKAGPNADEGGQEYALSFDCVTLQNGCPARLAQTGESLGAPAIAADPRDSSRILLASLAGASHDAVALQTSTNGGATFTRSVVVSSGARMLALAPGEDGRALLAVAGADGVSVWRFAFGAAPGSPEAKLAAPATIDKLGAIVANGTPAVAWHAGGVGRLAWNASWQTSDVECASMSELVALRGVPTLACDAGDATDIWALNATAGNLTRISRAPVVGEPHLVTTGDRLILGSLKSDSSTVIHFRVATAVNGTGWRLPLDAGTRIHRANATPAQSARVLAMSYQSNSGTIHLIWEETPAGANATDRRVVKSLVALSSRGAFYYKHDLDVDEPQARAQGGALLAAPTDARDALFVLGTREWIAFGDDGALVFGELREHSLMPRDPVTTGNGQVSKTSVTPLTNGPPPKFTLGFVIVAGILVTGVIGRVLLGRVSANASIPKDQKDTP